MSGLNEQFAKLSMLKASVGSNPTPSAISTNMRQQPIKVGQLWQSLDDEEIVIEIVSIQSGLCFSKRLDIDFEGHWTFHSVITYNYRLISGPS